jgi:hypothetical protein
VAVVIGLRLGFDEATTSWSFGRWQPQRATQLCTRSGIPRCTRYVTLLVMRKQDRPTESVCGEFRCVDRYRRPCNSSFNPKHTRPLPPGTSRRSNLQAPPLSGRGTAPETHHDGSPANPKPRYLSRIVSANSRAGGIYYKIDLKNTLLYSIVS